jgi:hypothetical protein
MVNFIVIVNTKIKGVICRWTTMQKNLNNIRTIHCWTTHKRTLEQYSYSKPFIVKQQCKGTKIIEELFVAK